VGKTVTIQGTDSNGVTVISTDTTTNSTILGEIVTLAVPFTDTVNQFATITGIEKEVTFGPVTIHQVDPTTFTEDSLSSMEPSETSAAYRRYLLNGLPNFCCTNPVGSVSVTAMVKLEFVPIASDSDYLLIPNVPALIAECECLRMENMDNVKAQGIGQQKHAKALQLLFGELDHYLGRERPAINVPIFGSDRLIRQPI
jgi:hypothetical protein